MTGYFPRSKQFSNENRIHFLNIRNKRENKENKNILKKINIETEYDKKKLEIEGMVPLKYKKTNNTDTAKTYMRY